MYAASPAATEMSPYPFGALFRPLFGQAIQLNAPSRTLKSLWPGWKLGMKNTERPAAERRALTSSPSPLNVEATAAPLTKSWAGKDAY
jgi:hypothetical protein